MVRIRLERSGVRNKPFYRIIVTDRKQKKGGSKLDTLGFWHPGKGTFKLDKEKLESWVKKGAKTTKSLDKLCSNYL